MLSTILIIFLVLMLVGTVPVWPHSRNYGYFPSGIGGFLLIVVIIMMLRGSI